MEPVYEGSKDVYGLNMVVPWAAWSISLDWFRDVRLIVCQYDPETKAVITERKFVLRHGFDEIQLREFMTCFLAVEEFIHNQSDIADTHRDQAENILGMWGIEREDREKRRFSYAECKGNPHVI